MQRLDGKAERWHTVGNLVTLAFFLFIFGLVFGMGFLLANKRIVLVCCQNGNSNYEEVIVPVYPDYCACPNDNLLGQYVREQVPEDQCPPFISHLKECESCQMRATMLIHPEPMMLTMPNALRQRLTATPFLSSEKMALSQAKHFAASQHSEARHQPVEKLEAGQIWLTKGIVTVPGQTEPVFATASPYLVLITLDDEAAYDPEFPEIRVAPICPPKDRQFMGPWDLWVEETESPLGFAFFVPCWNTQPMLRCNLDRIMGQQDDALLDQVLDLADQLIGSDATVTHAHIPERQLEEMVSFQSQHLEDTHYLRAPVNALVQHWEEQGG